MPNNFKSGNAAANAALNAMTALLTAGFLDIYDGAQPADADAAIAGQVKLASLRLGTPAFGQAAAGTAIANAIAPDPAAAATGTAAWFRAWKADHTTPVCDGSVGVASADLLLNNAVIQARARVEVTSWLLTLPKTV